MSFSILSKRDEFGYPLKFDTVSDAKLRRSSGNDEYTKLLLHGDSLFTDSSSSAHVFTNSGTTIDTTNKKFGAGSLYFSGAYIQATASTDWDLGSLFTVDFWIRPTALGSYQKVISTQQSGAYYEFMITNSNYIASENSAGGGIKQGTTALAINTWYHVAITFDGTNIKIWLNGALDATHAYTNAFATSNGLRIGQNGQGGESFSGQIDELRISKGIVRWTAAFTPPTEAYH